MRLKKASLTLAGAAAAVAVTTMAAAPAWACSDRDPEAIPATISPANIARLIASAIHSMRRQRGSGACGASDWQLLQTMVMYSRKYHESPMHPLVTRGSRQILLKGADCISRSPRPRGAG